MPAYIKKNQNLLIVPNKCGSMYAEAVCSGNIIDESQVIQLMPAIQSSRISVTAIKRDPVQWYWSGYWHVSANRNILPVPPSRWTAKQHWRLALMRKRGIHQDPDSRFSDFDLHSWVDPWNQVYYTEINTHGVPVPPSVPVHWVDINSAEFVEVIMEFATNGGFLGRPINISNRVRYPMTAELESMLLELDDWSWRLGYDTRESIQQYRKWLG